MPIFGDPDILSREDSKIHRQRVLKTAVELGLIRNKEASLEYIDDTGRNTAIISKVIGLNEENALLHNNSTIPIKKISKVQI